MVKMSSLTFATEIDTGKVVDLEKVVSPTNQDKFCRRVREEIKKKNGSTFDCFLYGYRVFKAARSLLFSAVLHVESKRAKKSGYSDSMVAYATYYSLFHASFAMLCLHPQIEIDDIQRIKHTQLLNLVDNKFVQTHVLPKSYSELVERAKIMREMTSYFTPLSGLEFSTVPDILNIDDVLSETKVHLKYAFQLSNVMGSIYWNLKNKCPKEISSCKKWCTDNRTYFEENFDKLLIYPALPASKYWSYVGDGHYDKADLEEAFRHFHLDYMNFETDGICPVSHLQSMVDETTIDNLSISWVDEKEVMKFLRDAW